MKRTPELGAWTPPEGNERNQPTMEAIDLRHIDDPDSDLPEPRTLAAIRRDLETIEDADLRAGRASLDTARQRARVYLSGVAEGGDAWRAALDERLPEIDRLEREAVDRLDAMRRRVLADRDQLTRAPYRCGLEPDAAATAERKAAQLRDRLPHMDAAAVARALRGALLFADPVELAAWALCADDLEGRFPNNQKVKDDTGRDVYPRTLFREPIRQCQRATGDREALALLDRLEGTLGRVTDALAEITRARNAHDPSGDVGSLLARFQFGPEESAERVALKRRYDPAAVAQRLGAA